MSVLTDRDGALWVQVPGDDEGRYLRVTGQEVQAMAATGSPVLRKRHEVARELRPVRELCPDDSVLYSVLGALDTSGDFHAQCVRLVRQAESLREPGEAEFKADDRAGRAICQWIGERLELPYDGAVSPGSVHAALWTTFMYLVPWGDLGREWRAIARREAAEA